MSKIIGWSFLGLALFAVWIKLDTGLSFVDFTKLSVKVIFFYSMMILIYIS